MNNKDTVDTNQLPLDSTMEFAQTLEESKKTIQNEMIEPKAGRKRGRPRKSQDGVGATGPSPSVGTHSPSVAQGPAPDITNYLTAPLMALSKIPAARHGISELALSQDEAHACASSLNELLKAFAPSGQLNPKTAAILTVGVTFGSIGFSKYQIFLEKSPKKEVEPEKEIETPMFNPFQVDAVDHFRKE